MLEGTEELESRKMRVKLLIILFSPLIMLFLVVNALYYYTAVKPLVEYVRIKKNVEHLNQVLNSVRELQTERELSLIAPNGDSRLQEQREKVNLNILKSLVGQEAIESLLKFREKFDNKKADGLEIYFFYTNVIGKTLNDIRIYYRYSPQSVELYRYMLSKVTLLYIIEYAGSEMALSVLCASEFLENHTRACPKEIYEEYIEIIKSQEVYIRGLLRFLDTETSNKAKQEIDHLSDEHKKIRSMISSGLPLENYGPMKIHDIIKERVERIKDFYTYYDRILQDYLDGYRKKALLNLVETTLIGLPTFLFLLWLVFQFSRHYKTILDLSIRDALTGLYNSRFFWEWFRIEVEKAKRYNRSLALLMIDLDNFKPINDLYGHIVGDMVLKEIAKTIKNRIRKSDFVARYGGDEFVVVLIEINEKEALNFASNLKTMIENIRLKTSKGEVIPRVSVGVALYPDHGEDHLEVFAHADAVLMKIKKHGKGKVEVFKHETGSESA